MRARGALALASAVLALAAGFVGGWLLTGQPQADSAEVPGFTVYHVRTDTVSRDIPATGRVSWVVQQKIDVPATGRLTALDLSAGPVQAGVTPIAVDGVGVVVLSGAVPAYRTMKLGEHGSDIAQLQQYLRDSGVAELEVSGEFDTATANAVKTWSGQMGWPETASVPLGQVVFLPHLPATMTPAPDLRLGALIPSPALMVVGDQPTVTVTVTPDAASQIEPGTPVTAQLPAGAEQTSIVDGPIPQADGSVEFRLDPDPLNCTSGGCPGTVDQPAVITATIHAVPATTGLVIPVSAVNLGADGRPSVILADGTRRPVTLGDSAGGVVIVVSGLTAGDTVRIPAR